MATILDLKAEQQEALKDIEAAVAQYEIAQQSGRPVPEYSRDALPQALVKYRNATAAIDANPHYASTQRLFKKGASVPSFIKDGPGPSTNQKAMSAGYTEAFLTLLRSGGKMTSSELAEGFDPLFGGYALPAIPTMSAAMYEGVGGGSDASGGYSVSIPTDPLIVPLGLQDIGVRGISKVIPTANDIKIPAQTAFGTAGIKAESGSSTNTFSESDPTLGQFTLSAWMLGLTHTVSWELLQDAKMFQEFAVQDLINAIDIAEDNFFVNGTGSNQPQGLIGNVGTGTGSPYELLGTSADPATLISSTFDALSTLKATYFRTAGWLMSRATGSAIRKAQMTANLFAPVWARENGRDYLHGFPVTFSQNMPSLPTSTNAGVTPILFGSFQDGYVIGDRGGTGAFIKILDQPLATSGQTILLGYKRTDGRVRRSEAIQGISISHS